MENIVTFLKSCLSSKTAHGRVIRTLLQALLGVLAFFVTLLAIPEVQTLVAGDNTALIAGLSGSVAAMSAIWNALDKLWESIKEK